MIPGSEFEAIEPGLKIKIPRYNGLAIRTTHFQRLSNLGFERLFEYIKNNLVI